MPKSFAILFASALTGLLSCSDATSFGQAIKPAKRNDFIRLSRDRANKPEALQTAIRSYRVAEGSSNLQVDLIGAVHIGDKIYYQELNKRFRDYDVLLYELVAPQGTVIPKGGGKQSASNPISMLQGMSKDMLNLASQTEEIDYTKANFVHADMSPTEISETLRKRGDTPITVALSAMAEMMRQQNLSQLNAEKEGVIVPDDIAQNPLALLFDKQRDKKLKLLMAEQFANLGTDTMGQTINQILVKDRNAAAMHVFQKELAKGHKRIGIFYGAAHLPDFEERLQKDFGLKRGKTIWLSAWDLKKPSKNENKPEEALDQLLRTLLSPQK